MMNLPSVGHFPGDPRFLGYVLIPTEDDIKALQRDQWLSTHLLDLIIQRAGIRPDFSVDPFCTSHFLEVWVQRRTSPP